MDEGYLTKERGKGLLYLEAGTQNVAKQLRLFEASSKDISRRLEEMTNSDSNRYKAKSQILKPRSLSPNLSSRPSFPAPSLIHMKFKYGKSKRNKFTEAETWLNTVLRRGPEPLSKRTEEQLTHQKLMSQLQLLKPVKEALDSNFELVSEPQEFASMLAPVSKTHHYKKAFKNGISEQGKRHLNVKIIDTRTWSVRLQCSKCGIQVLSEQEKAGFECTLCRLGKGRTDSCGECCLEVAFGGSDNTPPRFRERISKKGEDILCRETEVVGEETLLRIILPTSFGKRLAKTERNLSPSIHNKVTHAAFGLRSHLTTSQHIIIPDLPEQHLTEGPLTPSFLTSSPDSAVENTISQLRNSTKSLNTELSVKLQEQSDWRTDPKFESIVTERLTEYVGEYCRCMRSLLRGVLQVLPEHASLLERCFRALIHLCDLIHQRSFLRISDLEEKLKSESGKQEETVSLKVKIKKMEADLLQREATHKAKCEGLARLNKRFEELLKLRPEEQV